MIASGETDEAGWEFVGSGCPDTDINVGAAIPRDVVRELRAQGFVDSAVSFTVNGRKCTLEPGTIDPRTVLAEYLRYELGLTGTKIGCGEGGCGACTVLITRPDPSGGAPKATLANSCLRPVLSLDGASVTTIEGVKSGTGDYHPVQKAMAECGGSQCGYCSPGVVMAMFGLLTEHGSNVTANQIEQQFQGNICAALKPELFRLGAASVSISDPFLMSFPHSLSLLSRDSRGFFRRISPI